MIMAREEVKYASKDYVNYLLDKQEYHNEKYTEYDIKQAFEKGAEWADEHPKSPWISVKNDLPCNHKELLLSTGYHTVTVFTYKKGGACGMDNMIVRNGKWEWEAWKENYLYWMPIPKFPKE